MRRIVVFGANSAIARAALRRWAEAGASLCLVGRNAAQLADTAADLAVRGRSPVHTITADLSDVGRHAALVAAVRAKLGGIDVAFLAYGVLGRADELRDSGVAVASLATVNFTSPVSLLTLLAKDFEAAGAGTLAVITSVAGDRGRQSNYVYGATKGGLSIALAGLRHRLVARGVRVLDLKVGQVDTPMTADCRKGLLWATPEDTARAIVAAVDRRSGVVYVPWFWRWIMLVIRLLPTPLFHRLPL